MPSNVQEIHVSVLRTRMPFVCDLNKAADRVATEYRRQHGLNAVATPKHLNEHLNARHASTQCLTKRWLWSSRDDDAILYDSNHGMLELIVEMLHDLNRMINKAIIPLLVLNNNDRRSDEPSSARVTIYSGYAAVSRDTLRWKPNINITSNTYSWRDVIASSLRNGCQMW